MFADLAGFTSAAESMDPEEVHAFLEPLMSHLHDVVSAHGGTVVNTMGDGFLAVFGAPVAHPDDAERAVRAAVATRDATRAWTTEGAPRFDVHAGIYTGWVFVAPSDDGFDIVGDTVNTASRVASLAPAGAIFVGEPTRALLGAAVGVRALEPMTVKGKAEPLAVFEVTETDAPSVQRLLETPELEFVGRERELATLEAAYAETMRERTSRVVYVGGSPGIGKSRLIAEFARTKTDVMLLVGGGIPFGDAIPWLSLATALRTVPQIAASPDVGALAAAMPVSLEDDRTTVAQRLGLVLGVTSDATARGSAGDLNFEIAAALRRYISALAEERPVVIVLEDLQWADPHVLAFVRWMRSEPWSAPVLLLAVGWDESPGGTADVFLGPLQENEGGMLLGSILSGGDVPVALVTELTTRSGGNPLFMQEIVRLLREREVLRAEGGRWDLLETTRPEVPETVHLVVAARIDGLAPEERRILRDAAVCGRTFSRAVLAALGWTSAQAPLTSLVDRGLIEGNGDEYAFTHAVIRDVAYDGLPRMERAEKHLAIAEWLRAKHAGDDALEMLAYHYGRAAAIGLFSAPSPVAPLAVEYLTKAGDRAYAQRAMREAESWYRQALEVDPQSAERAARAGTASFHPLIRHADTLFELGRYDSARAASKELLKIAEAVDDPAAESDALLHLARLDSLFGDVDTARITLTRARELAEDDPVREGRVVRALADTWRLADVDRMLAMLTEAAELFAAAGERREHSAVAEDLAYAYTTRGGEEFARWFAESSRLVSGDGRSAAALDRTLGFARFYAGDLLGAAEPLERALASAVDLGDVFIEVDARFLLARIALARTDFRWAANHAGVLVRLGRGHGLRRTEEEGLVVQAFLAAREGRDGDADAALDLARALLENIGAEHELIEVTHARAVIDLERGRWDEAAKGARAYRSAVVRFRDGLEEPKALLLEGRAMLAAGRLDDACVGLRESLDRAEDQRDVISLAESCLGEALALLGRHDEARGLLGDTREDSPFPERLAARAEARAILERDAGAMDRAIVEWDRLGRTVWRERARAAKAALRGETRRDPLWPYAV